MPLCNISLQSLQQLPVELNFLPFFAGVKTKNLHHEILVLFNTNIFSSNTSVLTLLSLTTVA